VPVLPKRSLAELLGVTFEIGGGGVPFYRLILFTAVVRHAVVGLVPGLLDVFVGYVSHDIGE